MILSDGKTIRPEHLPASVTGRGPAHDNPRAPTFVAEGHSKTLREIEMDVIHQVLDKHGGQAQSRPGIRNRPEDALQQAQPRSEFGRRGVARPTLTHISTPSADVVTTGDAVKTTWRRQRRPHTATRKQPVSTLVIPVQDDTVQGDAQISTPDHPFDNSQNVHAIRSIGFMDEFSGCSRTRFASRKNRFSVASSPIHECHDNIAVLANFLLSHNDKITVRDLSIDHRVARDVETEVVPRVEQTAEINQLPLALKPRVDFPPQFSRACGRLVRESGFSES